MTELNKNEKDMYKAIKSKSQVKVANLSAKLGKTTRAKVMKTLKEAKLVTYNASTKTWAVTKKKLPVAKKKTVTKKPVAKKKTGLARLFGDRKPAKKKPKKLVPSKGTGVKDYGTVPARIKQYEPIKNFNPKNPPAGYIVVKMDHEILDDMLISMTRKKARAVAVPCREI